MARRLQCQPMMERCNEIMTARQDFLSHIQAADAKLSELLAKMNVADGKAKVDALARVMAEMIFQRKSILNRWVALEPQIIRHMIEHSANGGAKECQLLMDAAGPDSRFPPRR